MQQIILNKLPTGNLSCRNFFQSKTVLFDCLTGIHIRSRPVVPEDYNLERMTEVTPKDILWTSEVLLDHKIFPKILILLV